MVRFAVELELPAGNAPRDPSGDGTEIRAAGDVGVKIIETKDHVSQTPMAIRCEDPGDDAAVGDGFDH
jgi:hypothetical protein